MGNHDDLTPPTSVCALCINLITFPLPTRESRPIDSGSICAVAGWERGLEKPEKARGAQVRLGSKA
jgi:hypothetical protein